MDLVLFEDAMKHVCRIGRIISTLVAMLCWSVSAEAEAVAAKLLPTCAAMTSPGS